MKAGLDTQDVARIHEEALLALVSAQKSRRSRNALISRAGGFFAETIIQLEKTHGSGRDAHDHLRIVIEKLTQRTLELAASNEELKHEIAQRKEMEISLRTSELTSSQLLAKSRQMQEDLRHLSRRLLSAQEDERKRISRELHDVIAQSLTGINVRLGSLKSEAAANVEDLQKKIALTQRLVEKSVETIHRFARDLRPTLLDDLGLIPALHSYLKTFMERTGIRAELAAFSGVEKLDITRRTILYRVALEALANVARHSKASRVKVTVRDLMGSVVMEIHDNGKGFQVDGSDWARGGERLLSNPSRASRPLFA